MSGLLCADQLLRVLLFIHKNGIVWPLFVCPPHPLEMIDIMYGHPITATLDDLVIAYTLLVLNEKEPSCLCGNCKQPLQLGPLYTSWRWKGVCSNCSVTWHFFATLQPTRRTELMSKKTLGFFAKLTFIGWFTQEDDSTCLTKFYQDSGSGSANALIRSKAVIVTDQRTCSNCSKTVPHNACTSPCCMTCPSCANVWTFALLDPTRSRNDLAVDLETVRNATGSSILVGLGDHLKVTRLILPDDIKAALATDN